MSEFDRLRDAPQLLPLSASGRLLQGTLSPDERHHDAKLSADAINLLYTVSSLPLQRTSIIKVRTYTDECRFIGRGNVALVIHVHDRSSSATWRPRCYAHIRLEEERSFALARERDVVVGLTLDTCVVEGIRAGAFRPGWDLGESCHVGS